MFFFPSYGLYLSNIHFKTQLLRADLSIPVLTGISACHLPQINRQLWLHSTQGELFVVQNSLHFVLSCKGILFPVSIFMVNYFNLYSCSYDLVTIEILRQRNLL